MLKSDKSQTGASPTRVKDLMKTNPVIIPPDYTLKEAAQEMEIASCGMLPVGTPDKIEGIITDRDIVLRAVAKGKDMNKEKVAHYYMTPDVFFIHQDEPAARAADLMRERNVSRLVVEDSEGIPRGILTFGRIMRENKDMREITDVIESIVGRKAA